MDNKVKNISNSIEQDRISYIWNKFFERISTTDENKEMFSSFIGDVIYTHISWKNPLSKINKIKNHKLAKYSQHIIQSFWYYILLKYSNNQKIETKEQWDEIVDNFIKYIATINEEQLKELIGNIFNITKRAYSELYSNYNKLSKINDEVKWDIHSILNINWTNFHDIIIERWNIEYLPKILQYFIFPKKSLNWTDSIFLNNVESDIKCNRSNFSTFTDLFKLRSVFTNLDELYNYFWEYFKNNKKQNSIDFYRYFNSNKELYENAIYLIWERELINYDNIFFQWFIEHKKYELSINKKKTDSKKWLSKNQDKLSINDIITEFDEILELFNIDFVDNIKEDWIWIIEHKTIVHHLLNISDDFYDIKELISILRIINSEKNNKSNTKNQFIDVEILNNWINFIYYYKINKDIDSFIPISNISFTKDENWNITKSENYSELLTSILMYIDWYLQVKWFNEEKKYILKILILNWILRNLVEYISYNSNNSKLSLIINWFNVIEKVNIEDKKFDQNLFPIKNIKHKYEYKNLNDLLLTKKDDFYIWTNEVILDSYLKLPPEKETWEKLKYIRDNKEEISKNILSKLLKEKKLNTFSKLTSFILQNENTIEILLSNENYSKEIRDEINILIKKILEDKSIIKSFCNYTTVLNNSINLYEISKKHKLDFNKDLFIKFLENIDNKLIIWYLWMYKIKNCDAYKIIIEYLNERIEKVISDIIGNRDYYTEKMSELKFKNIYDKIEIISGRLFLYETIIEPENKDKFRIILKNLLEKKLINYFERTIKIDITSITENTWVINDYYYMFFSLNRLLKNSIIKLWVTWLDLSFFKQNERLRNYDAIRSINKSKKKWLKNKSNFDIQKIEEYSEISPNTNNTSNNNTKDIYESLNEYSETNLLKISIYEHIELLWKDGEEVKIADIEKFLSDKKIFDSILDNNKLKVELILFYTNKLVSKNINLFKSEIICEFINENFELFCSHYGYKFQLLNYLSLLWFFNYVYNKETWKNIKLTNENICFIEEKLKTSPEMYDLVKNYMFNLSKEAHNSEVQRL